MSNPSANDKPKPPVTYRIALRGEAILDSPRWNKGTAFTDQERKEFGLAARLPSRVNTIDEQCQRAWEQIESQESDLQKNAFLQTMKDQNWILYYQLLLRHLRQLMPIVYTPTEADAIANYSHLFRRPSEGLYLTFTNKDTMEEDYVAQTRGREIDLVVCSDAEAILGIGDQGVGGIGISSAKAVIYTLIGRMDPSKTLSVALDVGTDNEKLLDDPLYVGWPHKRVRGEEYDQFVDKFVQLVRKYHPHCLLHFEDFGVSNAQRLLELYRSKHAVFNDDVQGTGAVTLAAVMAAIGVTKTKLSDQRYIIFGAGSAGLGIARQLRDAAIEMDGLSREDATKLFYLVDKYGLIKESLGEAKIRPQVAEFVRKEDDWAGDEVDLLDLVKRVKPTVLIGCSTKGGAFTEDIVREMVKGTERPIIFPLSNPSRLVEVDPAKANEWSNGKALLATGSPFPPAKMPDGKDYIIAECNNALIYPGLGLGTVLSRSREMTDTMILAGTRRLASLSPALKDPDDALLPDFVEAPDVNFEVAVAVAEQAIEEGSAGVDWSKDEVRQRVRDSIWLPEYGTYVYDPEGEQ